MDGLTVELCCTVDELDSIFLGIGELCDSIPTKSPTNNQTITPTLFPTSSPGIPTTSPFIEGDLPGNSSENESIFFPVVAYVATVGALITLLVLTLIRYKRRVNIFSSRGSSLVIREETSMEYNGF